MKAKSTLLTLLFVGITSPVFCQIDFSLYGSTFLSKAGIGYSVSDKIRVEFRVYENPERGNRPLELNGTYSFINKSIWKAYGGVGFRSGLFPAVVFPLGVTVSPIKNTPQLSLLFELEPAIDLDDEVEYDDNLVVEPTIGIRYFFNKS